MIFILFMIIFFFYILRFQVDFILILQSVSSLHRFYADVSLILCGLQADFMLILCRLSYADFSCILCGFFKDLQRCCNKITRISWILHGFQNKVLSNFAVISCRTNYLHFEGFKILLHFVAFFKISAQFQCRNITQKCNKTSCCIVA